MSHLKLWTIGCLTLGLLAGAGCAPSAVYPRPDGPDDGDPAPAGEQLSPEEFDRLRRALVAWFECEECTEGQLRAVVAFGEKAVPSLVATLEQGPSPAQLEELRRALETSWAEIQRHQRTNRMELPGGETGLPGSREQYLETYLGNYVALYRVRAAQALAAIGGERAERALRSALDEPYREDVRRAIGEAVEGLRQR